MFAPSNGFLGHAPFFGYIACDYLKQHVRFPLRYLLVFIFTVSLTSAARAQVSEPETQLRLAQSFEQSGDWDRAVVLYERLHKAQPENEVFFEGLRRAYVHVRAFDKAINLVEERLRAQPFNIGLLATLGGIYYESGSEPKADSVWNSIVKTDPKNISLYRLVASEMMEHRLFTLAVKVYLAARDAVGKDNIFADDLATLYTFLQQYDAASKEFITMLSTTPQQLPFIESRIASFTMQDAGLHAAVSVTRDAVNDHPDNITFHRLYAWLAMEGHNYRQAFEEYKTIDRLSNADGAELLGFARRASQEGSELVASQAFHEILGLSHNPTLVSQARFGYARSVEELNTESDSASSFTQTYEVPDNSAKGGVSETEKGFQNVLQLYESLIKDYPNSELAAQSLYRIGLIKLRRISDLGGSLDSFEKSKSTTKNIDLLADASSQIAEVYILQNNLPAARREYQAILQLNVPAYQQMAQLQIARLDYYDGKFDAALTALKPLASNLRSDVSNDALLLQYFITENQGTFAAALVDYAKANLLMRQQKYSEALARFKAVIATFPSALLVDDAALKIGELHLLLNQINEGLAAFQHIVDDMPESILRDRAQMRIAETYQHIFKDKSKAIAAYEKVLAKFPNSLYAEQARKRIRLLRGDAS